MKHIRFQSKVVSNEQGMMGLVSVMVMSLVVVTTLTSIYIYTVNRAKYQARIRQAYQSINQMESVAQALGSAYQSYQAGVAQNPGCGANCCPGNTPSVNFNGMQICWSNVSGSTITINGVQFTTSDNTLEMKQATGEMYAFDWQEKLYSKLDKFFESTVVDNSKSVVASYYELPREPNMFGWVMNQAQAYTGATATAGESLTGSTYTTNTWSRYPKTICDPNVNPDCATIGDPTLTPPTIQPIVINRPSPTPTGAPVGVPVVVNPSPSPSPSPGQSLPPAGGVVQNPSCSIDVCYSQYPDARYHKDLYYVIKVGDDCVCKKMEGGKATPMIVEDCTNTSGTNKKATCKKCSSGSCLNVKVANGTTSPSGGSGSGVTQGFLFPNAQ